MLLLSLHLLAPLASALDVDTFSFSSSAFDAQGGMQVEAPTLGWPGAVYGGLGLVYAHDPLVQTFADGTTESVVTDSFATRLAVGYTLLGKVRLALDLPLYPYVGGGPDAAFNGVSSGDARLRGVIRIPLGEDAPVDLAVIPMFSLPTGEPSAYTGTGGVGGGLAAAAGVHLTDKLDLVANLGFRANKSSELGEQVLGSGLDMGLGGTYALGPALSVGLELDGTVDVLGGLGPWTDNPFELHAYGRYGRDSGVQAMLGLGTGLVGGVGAPDVRVIGGIGYRAAGKEPIYDIDEDGIFDDVDACVEVPEDKDGFEDTDGCPEADNDKDGIADTADACPNDAEDIDQFEDSDGCPDPDNDKDGVLDGDDECPLEPGTVGDKGCPDQDADTLIDKVDACPEEAGPVNTKGCPDRDGDRVPDKRDKCPDEPADPRVDPERSDGCPKRVFVTVDRIEILEKIYFDTNKTTIKRQSYPLLEEIASVLNGNPDIRMVEVAGHTDSVGNDSANLKLSQGRAESVVKYLTTTGKVDPARLTGVGYGEARPLETNDTEAGRGNNRRVEFVIKSFDGTFGPLGAAPAPRPVVVGASHAEPVAAPAPVAPPAPAPVVAPPAPVVAPPAPASDPWGGGAPAPAPNQLLDLDKQ
ncbi:MAG: OmpA family protein [Pseudomonadota bacterium]|nr:OmpA family protein [Pseudomonadota bacterium]